MSKNGCFENCMDPNELEDTEGFRYPRCPPECLKNNPHTCAKKCFMMIDTCKDLCNNYDKCDTFCTTETSDKCMYCNDSEPCIDGFGRICFLEQSPARWYMLAYFVVGAVFIVSLLILLSCLVCNYKYAKENYFRTGPYNRTETSKMPLFSEHGSELPRKSKSKTLSKSGKKQPATDGKQPATDRKQPATDRKQPATDGKQPATDGKQPATDGKAVKSKNEDNPTTVKDAKTQRSVSKTSG